MGDLSPGEVRAEIRSWLRRAIQFGSLANLPTDDDPDGTGRRPDAVDRARGLLAELTDPAIGRGSVAEVVAEARAFREWVEDRLRASRRRFLNETRPGRINLDPPPPRRLPTASPPTDKPPPHLRPVKEPNPLWDRWLDG
jgi:hypothetical protein